MKIIAEKSEGKCPECNWETENVWKLESWNRGVCAECFLRLIVSYKHNVEVEENMKNLYNYR